MILLTIADCSRMLQLGRTAVYEAARTGRIPVIRMSRAIRVPKQALLNSLGIAPSSSPPHVDGKSSAERELPQISKLVKIEGHITFSGTLTVDS
jgi:hypothetical protein